MAKQVESDEIDKVFEATFLNFCIFRYLGFPLIYIGILHNAKHAKFRCSRAKTLSISSEISTSVKTDHFLSHQT